MYTPIDFYEQAKHIRGPYIDNFTFCTSKIIGAPKKLKNKPRPLIKLGSLIWQKNFKSISWHSPFKSRWTKSNQEFSHWINRKRRGPQRNLVDICPINVSPPICFHLNRVGNGKDDISSKEHFRNSKISRRSHLHKELSIFVHIFEFYPMSLSL